MCKKTVRLLSFVLVLSLAAVGWSGVSKPIPANGAVIEETWANIAWTPGNTAASFDVYFGENPDDVKDGTGDTFRGNQPATNFIVGFFGFPYPEGLVPGTIYYWRVVEIQTDGTIHAGSVWSFSILSPTATNPDPVDGTQFVDPNTVTLSWTPGFGAKLHTVYFGDDFDEVNNATGGIPQGTTTYSPTPLELEKVYYWRVDEFDVVATHKGQVWSFTTPGAVGNPQPSNGATDVQMNKILSWTPADSAASHELYFGTDKETVRTAGTGSSEYIGPGTLGTESYDPGLLEPEAAYSWRVDEVDSQGNVSKGPLWSFATGDILLVDDFESYDDVDPLPGESGVNRIFDKWIDGFGTTTNGALAGNDLPPYAEPKIVHSGLQSMPLLYQNTDGVTYSEAEQTFVDLRDWTVKDVSTLTLYVCGKQTNAPEPMYVSLNGSSPVYHENPNASQIAYWTVWNINLQVFADQGVDLTNVNKIAIGFGDKNNPQGGTGTVYFDDIRLAITAPPVGRALPFYEDFESVVLSTSVEEAAGTEEVWTDRPPAGWVVDESGVPGIGDPANDGVTEWAGWAFADKEFWISTDGQRRGEFTLGQGVVAVADGDEWDDAAHPGPIASDPYDTWLSTPVIDISGAQAGTVQLTFDSSWRPEFDDNYHQTANITASFDGAEPIEILLWESDSASPNFKDDNSTNETITVDVDNPPWATTVVLTFGYFDAGNDWWWAIDNIEVSGLPK